MKFDYANLKACEQTGQLLGYWKGNPVKVISKRNITKTDSKNVYIIYDDGNVVYKDGWAYGKMDINGQVHETDVKKYRRTYDYVSEKKLEKSSKKIEMKDFEGKDILEISQEGRNLLDEIDRSVEKLLADACKW